MHRMKFIFILVSFFQLLDLISSKNIDCNYIFQRISISTSIYCCDIANQLNITSKPTGVITSSNGTHDPHKSNDDVACLASHGNKVQYFPQNLQNVFKNLKRICIQDGQLKELNQEDLKPFHMLTELNLVNNDLMVLEDGLFEYNSELTLADLYNNKIVHIGQYIFEDLSKLTFLDIRLNICIDMDAKTSLAAVNEVIKQFRLNCTNSEFVDLKRDLKALEDEYEYIVDGTFVGFAEKVKKFQETYENSTFMNLTSVNETIKALLDLSTQPMWIINKQMKQLEKTMTSSNRSMMKKIEGMNRKPNMMELATSNFSMWVITGLIVIIALVLIYRNTFRHYRFPVMMI